MRAKVPRAILRATTGTLIASLASSGRTVAKSELIFNEAHSEAVGVARA